MASALKEQQEFDFRATVLAKLIILENNGVAVVAHLEKLNGKVADHEKFIVQYETAARVRLEADNAMTKVKALADLAADKLVADAKEAKHEAITAAEKVKSEAQSARQRLVQYGMPVVYFILLAAATAVLSNAQLFLKLIAHQ
jgi:hypothetical protein